MKESIARIMLHGVRGILVLLTMGILISGSFAGEYYVAQNGDDHNPGTLSQPWRTIAKANVTLNAGDKVFIRAGTYLEDINPVHSGTLDNQITYMNYAGEEVILRGPGKSGNEVVVALGWPGSAASWGSKSNITIDGLKIEPIMGRYGIIIYGYHSKNIVIRNCKIINKVGGIRDGILIGQAENTIVENNLIEGNWRLGIITTATPKRTIIRGNTILHSYNSGIDIQTSYGTIQGTLIEDNIIGESQIEDGIQFEPNYVLGNEDPGLNRGVIIRNNVIYNNAENGIDLKGADYVVVEKNHIWGNRGDNNADGNRGGGSAIMRGLESRNENILIRHNVIYDNSGGIDINSSGWVVVHNTILGNNRDFTGTDSYWDGKSGGRPILIGIRMMYKSQSNEIRNVIVKNNIIGGHHQGEIAIRTTANLSGTGVDGNLYYNDDQVYMVTMTDYHKWDNVDIDEWRARLLMIPGMSATDKYSVVENPEFSNVPTDGPVAERAYDFSLSHLSPAINKGLFLTKTRQAGSGIELPVENARFFNDGFGIVDGDEVQIASSGERVKIVSIDYDMNTLTLDRTITWQAGDGVSLSYYGPGPDIGAVEFEGTPSLNTKIEVSETSGYVPFTIDFNVSIAGGTPPYQYAWDFGDGNSSNEQNPTHTFTNVDNYKVTLKTTDSEGSQGHDVVDINVLTLPSLLFNNFEQHDEGWGGAIGNTGYMRDSTTIYSGHSSMRVFATNSKSKLSIGVNPETWNMHQYPLLSFAYKIPDNVPVGIFFNTDAGWICLGGTHNYNPADYPVNDAYRLIDDNEWHLLKINVKDKVRDVFPYVKNIYEFEWYTHENGQQEDVFWFDDVRIYTDIPSPVDDSKAKQGSFLLGQNYPNPFNPVTSFNYFIRIRDNISLNIYDLLGRKVKTLLINEYKEPGFYNITWNGTDDFGTKVPSGIYFARMVGGGSSQIKKLIIQK